MPLPHAALSFQDCGLRTEYQDFESSYAACPTPNATAASSASSMPPFLTARSAAALRPLSDCAAPARSRRYVARQGGKYRTRTNAPRSCVPFAPNSELTRRSASRRNLSRHSQAQTQTCFEDVALRSVRPRDGKRQRRKPRRSRNHRRVYGHQARSLRCDGEPLLFALYRQNIMLARIAVALDDVARDVEHNLGRISARVCAELKTSHVTRAKSAPSCRPRLS